MRLDAKCRRMDATIDKFAIGNLKSIRACTAWMFRTSRKQPLAFGAPPELPVERSFLVQDPEPRRVRSTAGRVVCFDDSASTMRDWDDMLYSI
jgi:hypothetical protein